MKIFCDFCYLNVFVVIDIVVFVGKCFWVFLIIVLQENIFGFIFIYCAARKYFWVYFLFIVLDKSFILLLRISWCDGEIKAT